jgi:ABC-type Mn2+/Zn2+ transport system ATPase subunit
LDDGLSVGQRSIAILAILLSSGDEPLVLDQPEDDIDNEFIFQELVPLLRQSKQLRQIILATHDPNLTVIGDAELVYALEARADDAGKSRGRPKQVQVNGTNLDAIGSLDQTEVRQAVAEVMEGSEKAFRRRHDSYGY